MNKKTFCMVLVLVLITLLSSCKGPNNKETLNTSKTLSEQVSSSELAKEFSQISNSVSISSNSSKTKNSSVSSKINSQNNAQDSSSAIPELKMEKILINSGSIFEFYDGWLYFSECTDNKKLYRMRPNGSEKTLLKQGLFPCNQTLNSKLKVFNRYENTIGVFTVDHTSLIFEKMLLDGSKSTSHSGNTICFDNDWAYSSDRGYYCERSNGKVSERISSDFQVQNAFIKNGYMYFNMYTDFSKISLDDSKNNAPISLYRENPSGPNSGNVLYVDDTNVYGYSTPPSGPAYLFAVNIDGSNFRVLDSSNKVRYGAVGFNLLGIIDNKMYFAVDNKIVSVNIDGSGCNILASGDVIKSFNLIDDYIYYKNTSYADHTSTFERINLDGTKKEVLFKETRNMDWIGIFKYEGKLYLGETNKHSDPSKNIISIN